MFHSFYKLKILLAKLFSIQKYANVLWLCFTTWALFQCLTVVWYLQWKVLPCPVFYSVFKLYISLQCFCTVLARSTIIFYLDVTWDHGVQSPRRSRPPGNSVTFSTKKSEFLCSSLFTACSVSALPVTSTVFNTYLDVAWNKCDQKPGRNISLLSHSWNYTPLQFGFYSIKSFFIACEVSTVFTVVVFTQKWWENKIPESWNV